MAAPRPGPLSSAARALAAALALLGTAALGSGPKDAAQTWAPTLRRLESNLSKEDIMETESGFFSGEYIHAKYLFSLRRDHMIRDGEGEFWLSFSKDRSPRLLLKGRAESTRFGHGAITIVVDTAAKKMHAAFNLAQLHEEQCITYPFPEPADQKDRMDYLKGRLNEVMKWKDREEELAKKKSKDAPLLEVNWTKSYSLRWNLEPESNQILGFEMRDKTATGPDAGDRVIKNVTLFDVVTGASPDDVDDLFKPPLSDCRLDSDIPEQDRMADVQLKPPHQKSSALNDLLLALQDHKNGEKWEQIFILLSVITVPGDVSVLIEDPPPPDLAKLHNVRFDYQSTVMQNNDLHRSNGSVWLGLDKKTFRLRGEAKGTKVGNLTMDLVAKANDKIYANVNLSAQNMSQCVIYDYPEADPDYNETLTQLELQGLSFWAIAELEGEDCAIFVAEMNRGLWLHVWVDMERTQPSMILRTEVHKEGEVVRSTNMLSWSAGEHVNVGVEVKPEWNCSVRKEGDEQLARLGLSQPVHERSIQLQDALYGIEKLHPDFALIEVLGLTGDVGIMVQEPRPPDLTLLPAVTFSYSVALSPDDTDSTVEYIVGNFAADLETNHIRITAGGGKPDSTNVTVSMDADFLAVQIVEQGGMVSCLTLPVEDSEQEDQRLDETPGIFDMMEQIDGDWCDKFLYFGTGVHKEEVEFWFSMEKKRVCRLEVLPGLGQKLDHGFTTAQVDIPEWILDYSPAGGVGSWEASPGEERQDGPPGWKCSSASESQSSWLSLADDAPDAQLPSAVALAKLGEASGVVRLLPEKFANMLSRIVVTSPSKAAQMPAQTPGPTPSTEATTDPADCEDFSGDWRTSIGTDVSLVQVGCRFTLNSPEDNGWDHQLGAVIGHTANLPEYAGTLVDGGSALRWEYRDGTIMKWTRGGRDSGSPPEPVISALSEELQTFSFSFKSAYPLAGDKGLRTRSDGSLSYSPTHGAGETQGMRRSSKGEMRVDLANRMLYLNSDASDISMGIRQASSAIILRGDQSKLYARTRIPSEEYDECWTVHVTQLPAASGKRQPNPFQYGDRAGDCGGLHTGGFECKERRVLWLDSVKRLEFFVDDAGRLLGMVLDDTAQDVAAGITVDDFSTQPSGPEWFEPAEDWNCRDIKRLPDTDRFAEWDLIRAFFPLRGPVAEDDAAEAAQRRLFPV